MKSRNLFLGIIILFVGVVALLSALNVIDFRWIVAWRLWPMLFIFAGIAILPIKEGWRAVLLLATLAVGVLLYRYEDSHSTRHWLFSQAEKAQSEMCLTEAQKS
ncbi:MAG: hypothetical protein J6T22_05035 [Bacteroidales bacterium]|jgi:hypothetical protein|nr:hypothetical protein [Bacteroidales bacterium]